MEITGKTLLVILISLLMCSNLSLFRTPILPVNAQPEDSVEEGLPLGASLTGNVVDAGVDMDDDGLFDYLQIGVEVNLTHHPQPWSLYRVEVHGLTDSKGNRIYIRQSAIIYQETGLQMVHIPLYGPTIYQSDFNPVNISSITLYKTWPSGWYRSRYLLPNIPRIYWHNYAIDSLYDLPLSKEYSYTDFDPPFKDLVTRFIVYPQGRVAVAGGLNYTPPRPPFGDMPLKGAVMKGSSGIASSDNLTIISDNHTLLMPPEYASKFPLNSTTFSMLETLSDDIINTGANFTVIYPPYVSSKFPFNATDVALNLTYSHGILDSEFGCSTTLPPSIWPPDIQLPTGSEQMLNLLQFFLNNTDLSVVGQYQGGELNGTISVHMLPGFALGEVTMGFEGNRTSLSASGDVRVFYGSYYGFELDQSTLEQILVYFNSTLPSLLQEMTQGAANFTVTTAMTPIAELSPGADVHFEMDVEGDLMKAIASSISSRGIKAEEIDRIREMTAELTALLAEKDALTNETTIFLQDLAETVPEEEERINETIASLEDLTLLIAEEENRTDEINSSLAYLEELISGEGKDEVDEEISALMASFKYLTSLVDEEKVLVSKILAYLADLAEAVPEEEERINEIFESLRVLMEQEEMYLDEAVANLQRLEEVITQEEERERMRAFIYSALNETVSSAVDGSFQLGYTHSTRQISMKSTFTYDVRSLVGALLPLLPQIGVPQELPDLLNATFSCAKTASAQMTYTKTEKKFDLQMTAVQDVEGYQEEARRLMLEILQNMTEIPLNSIPSELTTLMQRLMNRSFLNMKSYSSSLLYKDGREDIAETYTLEGDVNTQLNYLKEIFLHYIAEQYGRYGQTLPWQLSFLNETQVDVINLEYHYDVTETLMEAKFEGLVVSPPVDVINATRFKLERLLNLTGDMGRFEPPTRGERLKVTMEGGSNITHKVKLFRPQAVPEPNQTTPDMRRMVWYNQSLSDLKDMEFEIYTQTYNATVLVTDQMDNPIPNATVNLYYPNGTLCTSLPTDDYGCTEKIAVEYGYMPCGVYNLTASYGGVSASVPLTVDHTGIFSISVATKSPQVVETVTTPRLVDATENAATLLNITEISRPVIVAVRNVTAPPDVGPPPGTFHVLGNYVEIFANDTDILLNATLRIYYTEEQLQAAGLNENSLKIHCWNGTDWSEISSLVHTGDNYLEANITHFSLWAVMGQTEPFWTQPVLWIIIVILLVAVGALLTFAVKYRKQSSPQTRKSS